jgi:glycosyltransferase involved in cell wall biosynthesis
MNSTISVIVPFYGTSYSRRLELVAESVLSQKNIDVDFVIAGLDKATRISCLSDLLKYPRENMPDIVRTGTVINNGLKLARGEFTYVSDADVLLQNQNYLERLVQEHLAFGASLKRPPMRRLLLEDFEWFYSQVSSASLEKAITSLDKSQEYIVKPKGSERLMRVFPKFENGRQKIFIASESDFQEYISSEENKGSEPLYFNQDRHCGTVFTRTEYLIKVGGYHEGFISWGIWDADVQWKLENLTGMGLIPYNEDFAVIHLDHEKSHFSKSRWKHDRELQKIRRDKGANACIVEDKKIHFGDKNER